MSPPVGDGMFDFIRIGFSKVASYLGYWLFLYAGPQASFAKDTTAD